MLNELKRIIELRSYGYTNEEILAHLREAAWRLAAHRIPRKLAYWSMIDSGVRYTGGDDVIPEVPFMVVLERIGKEAL